MARFRYDVYRRKLEAASPSKDGGPLRYTEPVAHELCEIFGRLDIDIERLTIDHESYNSFLKEADYGHTHRGYLSFYKRYICKKLLEQVIATHLLSFASDDVFIDIAAERSPFAGTVERRYGCESYSQDLAYPPGIDGRRIGSSASSLPLAANSVTKISLLCSFEHFEGDEDILFMDELGRVLAPGGRAVIVPLYLSPKFTNYTDPYQGYVGRVKFDGDAQLVATRGWWNRFLRFYSPSQLRSRILDRLPDGMESTIYRIDNSEDFDSSGFVAFALVLDKS